MKKLELHQTEVMACAVLGRTDKTFMPACTELHALKIYGPYREHVGLHRWHAELSKSGGTDSFCSLVLWGPTFVAQPCT